MLRTQHIPEAFLFVSLFRTEQAHGFRSPSVSFPVLSHVPRCTEEPWAWTGATMKGTSSLPEQHILPVAHPDAPLASIRSCCNTVTQWRREDPDGLPSPLAQPARQPQP